MLDDSLQEEHKYYTGLRSGGGEIASKDESMSKVSFKSDHLR